LLFYADCNEQGFLNYEKNFGAGSFCRFREKHKNAPLIPKNDATDPKVRLL